VTVPAASGEREQLTDDRIDKPQSEPRRLVIRAGEQIYVGLPQTIPEELLKKLADHFRLSGLVDKAFFGQVYIPSSGQPPHLLIGMRLIEKSPRNFDDLLQEVTAIIATIAKSQLIDVIEIKNPIANLKLFFSK